MTGKSILIIDDDRDVLDALKILLEDEFEIIETEQTTNRIAALASKDFDLVLLDMNFSAGLNTGNEGLFWLSKILELKKDSSVIMMTAYGNIGLAVEAIKRGAKDFVLKPWDNEKLLGTLRAIIQTSTTKKPAAQNQNMVGEQLFVQGKSPAMMKLQEQINRVAATDANVLIQGENGSGKEVVARELHLQSTRSNHIFLSVDLSTLPENLFESELFGHKKGAFTDAKSDRKGRFEAASGGTLFLDEIGNVPVSKQAKLLTVLQNRQITPVGSNEPVSINVRLISATNASMQKLVEQGLFRQDLLYRINTITLNVPPLRERGQDILALASHFLNIYKKQYNRPSISFQEEASQLLLSYSWPGNVRELQHTIEKSVILASNDFITAADLSLSTSSNSTKKGLQTLDEIEKDAMIKALDQNAGNVVQAAKALGITRQTLYNKMKKYGL